MRAVPVTSAPHHTESRTVRHLTDAVPHGSPLAIPFRTPRKVNSLHLDRMESVFATHIFYTIPVRFSVVLFRCPHEGLRGRHGPFYTALVPKAQRGRVTWPQPARADVPGKTQTQRPTPPHATTSRSLPRGKSWPTSQFFKGTPHVSSGSLARASVCQVKGAAPLCAHA